MHACSEVIESFSDFDVAEAAGLEDGVNMVVLPFVWRSWIWCSSS